MTTRYSTLATPSPNSSLGRQSQPRKPGWLFATPFIGLLQLSGIGQAFADDQDAINQHVFNLEAGINLTLDNNLFRLPDSVNPSNFGINGSKRSDTVSSEYVGFAVDQPIGLQKLHLEAVVAQNKYHNYGYLDGKTTNYNGYWQLAFTPQLTGRLSSNRTQSAAGYATYQTYTARNIITSDNTDLNLDWSPLGNWHLTTNYADRSYISSVNSTAIPIQSYDSKVIEGGINYVFPSGANLALVHDKTKGTIRSQNLDVANQRDTGYQENADKLSLSLPLTTRSLLNAQIGHEERQYDHFASRNHSGSIGNLTYAQDITSKLNLSANASRTYYAYLDNNESFYTKDSKSLQAAWLATSKLTLKARLESDRKDYRQPLSTTSSPMHHLDNGVTHSLELDYAPLSTISVVASIVRDQRGSTIGSWNYHDTSVNLSINAKF